MTESNIPPPPRTTVPWTALSDLLAACGVHEPDFRKIRRLEYDQETRVVTVTRVRLNETGFRVSTPGGHLTETYQIAVWT